MLRDILRKMSKDDSHVRLKSLEQIIKLGENIVSESEEKKKTTQRSLSPTAIPTTQSNPSSKRSSVEGGISSERRSKSANQMRRPEVMSTPAPNHQSHNNFTPDFASSPMTMSALENNSGMKTIKRATKVPGFQPDFAVKKTRKVSHK